ncbi:MAG TPA: DUF4019 domain-containing protein [Thermoanaerobaculia bacterium]|nr:DUF4019 domain-containing protein [Thermoanaerobaculia bacterium]
MKTILWALAAAGTCLLAAAVIFGDQPAGKRADEAAMKAAESAAKSWLALMDSGQYARSWKEAAQQFRRQITKEEWEKSAKSARESLGKVLSRELKIEQYGQGMPGAPDAEYLVLVFDSSFENRKEAGETVVPVKEKDGVWRVAGYSTK